MNKKKVMKVVIIIGIIIIPLMYSFFYLKAFWDPYGNLKTIPIALVNQDTGELGTELVDNLKEKDVMDFHVLTEEQANEGLVNQEYYAVISIPRNFTDTLNSGSTKDKQVTTITYSPNQKMNYLGSQIINKVVASVETELTSQVNEKVVDTLANKLNEVPDQLQKVSNASGELKEGSSQLKEGIGKLQQGANTLDSSYEEFNAGVNTATQGSQTLQTGVTSLVNGIDQVAAGTATLTKSSQNLDQITSSAQALASSSSQLNNGISQYIAGVNSYQSNVNNYITQIIALCDANPALKQDPRILALYQGALQIKNAPAVQTLTASGVELKNKEATFNAKINEFSNATTNLPKLTEGIITLQDAVSKLQTGGLQVKSGSANLSNGLQTLSANSTKVQNGIRELSNGTTTALVGSQALYEGLDTFKNTVDTNLNDTKEQLTNLNGLSEYAKNPVQIDEVDYGKIDSYGVGFAPYFMSLSLWVGGLMIFIGFYYDPENRFKLIGRKSTNRLARTGIYVLFAAIQAIVLGFFLKLGLGFEVTNIWLYYGTCILISMVFLAIIQFLIVNFGDVGKFLSILFLVLQLAASGGTFPIETVPVFFQKIYNFMPMKYSIRLIKESIVSIDDHFALKNAGVLFIILAVFLVATIVFDVLKSVKAKRKAALSKG